MKLNKAEMEYLIDHVESYVRNGIYFINNIENAVTKNKDGSIRKNSRTKHEHIDSVKESLKFYKPLLEKLKAMN
jgi:hypothetical protein|tara:strand:- start:1545 stop:1766 length:222 start_codon:yes stop_codon:yes gene_type:complete